MPTRGWVGVRLYETGAGCPGYKIVTDPGLCAFDLGLFLAQSVLLCEVSLQDLVLVTL